MKSHIAALRVRWIWWQLLTRICSWVQMYFVHWHSGWRKIAERYNLLPKCQDRMDSCLKVRGIGLAKRSTWNVCWTQLNCVSSGLIRDPPCNKWLGFIHIHRESKKCFWHLKYMYFDQIMLCCYVKSNRFDICSKSRCWNTHTYTNTESVKKYTISYMCIRSKRSEEGTYGMPN